MKIKIERSQKEKTSKKKKDRTVSVGKHRKMVLVLWFLLIVSLSFGVYKNFTAIDQHTTHEKIVVKEKVVNTSGVENFTIDFAQEYFSWKNDKTFIEKRMSNLEQYLTEEGMTLSQDMVRSDIPTSSEVVSVKIRNVERKSDEFLVSFSLNQKITEGKKTQQVVSAYRVSIFRDKSSDYIVTSLPTMISKPTKADYQTKKIENITSIDASIAEEITEFLNTFFKIYPTASKKELQYYVVGNSLPTINDTANLKFVKIIDPIFYQLKDSFQTNVKVSYIDKISKTTQIFEYDLVLKKQINWKIVKVE